MKTLICGAGNLLLTDEGFGVHLIRHLEKHYQFPPEVELLDAGTLGLLVAHRLEEADRVYLVDVLALEGTPGQCYRYTKSDFMLNRIPVKLSPHQVGVQEMLLLSEMRGCCPQEIVLLGVIPSSIEPGYGLTPVLHQKIFELAGGLIGELRELGLSILERAEEVSFSTLPNSQPSPKG